MKKMAGFILLFLGWATEILSAAVIPHVGFVYPAGGLPGETLTVTIGGQYLKDFSGIHLSGFQVEAKMTDYLRIYDSKEAGRIKRSKETLEAKMAEEQSEVRKQQMQRQIDMLEPELAMVAEVRRENKMNPTLAAKKQFNPQISERITLEIKIPDQVKPDNYDLRVETSSGLSNPLMFQIGQLPERTEKEPNDRLTTPEKLTDLPVLINGQVLPSDIDYFQFHAVEGQTLVFKADARTLVPYLADAVPGWFQAVLTLYDSKGQEVAYNDDYFLNPDPVLIYNVPADGNYTLAIRDSIFRGREDFVYRLSIGELPFIERIFPFGGMENRETEVALYGVNLPAKKMKIKTGSTAPDIQQIKVEKGNLVSNNRDFSVSSLPDRSETEPNNTYSKACVITNDTMINGTIEKPGDQDWFCFEGRKGQAKTIEVSARKFGSPLDARLVLLDAQQKVLMTSDDVEDKSFGLMTYHADARIDVELPEKGTYFVRLDDLQGKGGAEYAYRLMIGEERPDFQLRIVPSSLRLPREGTAIATVHAIRYGGFTGEIRLELRNELTGIGLQRAVIPEKANSAQIIISASKTAEKQMAVLEIEGTADCGSRTVHRRAIPAEDMMQAFIYRHLVVAQELLAQVTDPDPVTVTVTLPSDGVIRARPDSEIKLRAVAVRKAALQSPVKLTISDPPEWLTLVTTTLKAEGSSEIVLKVSPNAEPGNSTTVVLNGSVKAKLGDKAPKFFNENKSIDFSIDALSIQITN